MFSRRQSLLCDCTYYDYWNERGDVVGSEVAVIEARLNATAVLATCSAAHDLVRYRPYLDKIPTTFS